MRVKRVQDRLTYVTNLFFIILYPFLSYVSVQGFNCREVGSAAAGARHGPRVPHSAQDLTCLPPLRRRISPLPTRHPRPPLRPPLDLPHPTHGRQEGRRRAGDRDGSNLQAGSGGVGGLCHRAPPRSRQPGSGGGAGGTPVRGSRRRTDRRERRELRGRRERRQASSERVAGRETSGESDSDGSGALGGAVEHHGAWW